MPDEPTSTPAPTPDVEFETKVRAWLVMCLLAAFTIVVVTWSFHPPQLPGDTAGTVIGGFIGWIGGMLTSWGSKK